MSELLGSQDQLIRKVVRPLMAGALLLTATPKADAAPATYFANGPEAIVVTVSSGENRGDNLIVANDHGTATAIFNCDPYARRRDLGFAGNRTIEFYSPQGKSSTPRAAAYNLDHNAKGQALTFLFAEDGDWFPRHGMYITTGSMWSFDSKYLDSSSAYYAICDSTAQKPIERIAQETPRNEALPIKNKMQGRYRRS